MAYIQTDNLTVSVSRMVKNNEITEGPLFIPGEMIIEIESLLTEIVKEKNGSWVVEVDRGVPDEDDSTGK